MTIMSLSKEKASLEKNWQTGEFYIKGENSFRLPGCSDTCSHHLNPGEIKSNSENPFEIGQLLGQGGQSFVYHGRSCSKNLGKSLS